jgi:hypothetical protein
MSNNKLKQTEPVSDSPIKNDHGIVKSKRKYIKNINNPRWKNQKIVAVILNQSRQTTQ